MKKRVFHVTDSQGLVEMRVAVSERAVRLAWKKHQAELNARWGFPPREIVSVVDPVEVAEGLAESNRIEKSSSESL